MSLKKSGSPKKPTSNNYMMAFLGVGLSVSVELAVSIGIGWWLGTWVDERWDMAPYGMITGLVLFLAASLTHSIIVLNHLNKKLNKEDPT